MIHDFAKLPRTYDLTAPVPARPRPRFRRRYLLGLVLAVAAAAITWHKLNASPVAKPEFHPGQKESRDYQAAMAEEKVVDAALPPKTVAATAKHHEITLSTPAATTEQQPKAVETPKEEKPKYGFYDTLTHSTWSVPIMHGVYVSAADRKQMENQRYMLQAASVRDVNDARRLVQKLRQAGLNASYITTEGGWNRINVGPFENYSVMNKAEDTLVAQGMMPLIRKIP